MYIIKKPVLLSGKQSSNSINNKVMSSSNFYYSMDNSENNLKIITLHDSSIIRIQHITIKSGAFLLNTFRELTFSHQIKRIIMHPTEEYLISLLRTNILTINQ